MAQSFNELLEQIESVLNAPDGAEVDAASFLTVLQTARPHFLDLLNYKVRLDGSGCA